MLERAPQGTACISPRGRRSSQGQSGESLEDGAERGEGGGHRERGEGGGHRERSMHASLDQAKYFLGQSGIMRRVQGYVIPY